MFNSKSILSTVRNLNSETTEEESSNHSNVSTLREMDAAISDLDTWRKQRETESNDLLRQMIAASEQEEEEAEAEDTEENNNPLDTPTSTSTTFLTAATPTEATSTLTELDDDDPVSLAYEQRLLAQLAALQNKRKKMEALSNSPEAPTTIHRLPTELLISASQIKTLTEDTRLHVGNKSVEALKNENLRMLMENKVRDSTQEIQEAAVMEALSAEGSEFENMAGLSNVLEAFDSQMADLLLKMDVVDTSNARRTPRSREEEEGNTVIKS